MTFHLSKQNVLIRSRKRQQEKNIRLQDLFTYCPSLYMDIKIASSKVCNEFDMDIQ